jgi:hypothetical protein
MSPRALYPVDLFVLVVSQIQICYFFVKDRIGFVCYRRWSGDFICVSPEVRFPGTFGIVYFMSEWLPHLHHTNSWKVPRRSSSRIFPVPFLGSCRGFRSLSTNGQCEPAIGYEVFEVYSLRFWILILKTPRALKCYRDEQLSSRYCQVWFWCQGMV